MSSVLRTIARRHARTLSRQSTPPGVVAAGLTPMRSFHSPFAVLGSHHHDDAGDVHASSSSASSSSPSYEKQHDHYPEPSRTYVVSEPDPADKPYQVPSGAFPTSAPYQNFTATEAPADAPHSSTSASPAHPITTGELASRNPAPDDPKVTEKFAKAGLDEAWSQRK